MGKCHNARVVRLVASELKIKPSLLIKESLRKQEKAHKSCRTAAFDDPGASAPSRVHIGLSAKGKVGRRGILVDAEQHCTTK